MTSETDETYPDYRSWRASLRAPEPVYLCSADAECGDGAASVELATVNIAFDSRSTEARVLTREHPDR